MSFKSEEQLEGFNEPKPEPWLNENSKFHLGDLVYVIGQEDMVTMTVVRVYVDGNAGPMLQACWIKSDGTMQLCSLPEAVFRKY